MYVFFRHVFIKKAAESKKPSAEKIKVVVAEKPVEKKTKPVVAPKEKTHREPEPNEDEEPLQKKKIKPNGKNNS